MSDLVRILEHFLFGGPMGFMAVCSFIVTWAFCPEYKRDWRVHTVIKAGTAFLLILLLCLLDHTFVDFNNASTALEAPFCILTVLFYMAVLLDVPPRETLYCTVWVYIVTEMTTQIAMPLSDMLSGGTTGWSRYMRMLSVELLALALVYWLVRRFLAVRLQTKEHYHAGRQKLLFSVLVAAVYLVLSNYQFIFWLLGEEPENGSNMITMFRLVVGILSMAFLYIQDSIEKKQKAEQELDMIQQLWYRQQDQYRMSQENIELINRKCHDLKHQMAALSSLADSREKDQQIREMAKSVMIYDSAVKTGNPVLDTVLTEKSLYCEEHHINMTCMADGTCLDFVGNVDLYTMFGNALDNAIESVMKQEDEQKRIIQVSVFHEKNLQMIRIRNYCDQPPEFSDGLPVSTKKDKRYHGYGLKSIRYTAEKYGGGIRCQASDNQFTLQILLPIPGRDTEDGVSGEAG